MKKILIANRGEIACRIIKTAQKMGLQTVAVYSDVDQHALHVRLADEAVPLGGSSSVDSYLSIDKIISACQSSGADAVHPGYGFLSENAQFAHDVRAAKLLFVGPSAEAIALMGDKITAKKIAKQAKVNIVSGYEGSVSDADHAVAVATSIGYPVMLKASAGGGGKGMRIARNDQDCREGFKLASHEAKVSFSDDRLFIEKYIENPRHIEIQILRDKSGHGVYLGERECSIQRRHQKVIEESPSTFIDPLTRELMGQQSLRLAEAVDYCSAGTIEFIVDQNKQFYFLEMNTRLQVEHPVTEAVTGYDLVELMLKIAMGEPLNIQQEDVQLKGWALECRVYAEDPLRQFLPSIGRLYRHHLETSEQGIRLDSGVEEGDDISIHYDPMISKLITFAESREQARQLMLHALNMYCIRGLNHNICFLSALLQHSDFISGEINTHFIEQHYPDGFKNACAKGVDKDVMVYVASIVQYRLEQRFLTQQQNHQIPKEYAVIDGQTQHLICVEEIDRNVFDIRLNPGDSDSSSVTVHSDWRRGYNVFKLTLNSQLLYVQIDRIGPKIRCQYLGCVSEFMLIPAKQSHLAQYIPEKISIPDNTVVASPMPGLLTSVDVSLGDSVQIGQSLATIEAMKMENTLLAQRAGIIQTIDVSVGDKLHIGEVRVRDRQEGVDDGHSLE